LGQALFLVGREQIDAPDLLEIHPDRIVQGHALGPGVGAGGLLLGALPRCWSRGHDLRLGFLFGAIADPDALALEYQEDLLDLVGLQIRKSFLDVLRTHPTPALPLGQELAQLRRDLALVRHLCPPHCIARPWKCRRS